ncbi:MAG: chitobiase/beta-hexosaminidase C-terminal domain-containing protein [Clostridiales bacterium]|nr:chitobiase/beta-hexosaminidase C-terminal domain-containing protein [Clostridiales bacterium]
MFADVSAETAMAANSLAALGILNGYPDGSFGESRDITRAEVTAITLRFQGLEAKALSKAGETPYSDVPAGNWASGYVNLATEMGIIVGDGTGRFLPADNVKFEEAVKMLVAGAGYGKEAIEAGGWPDGYISVARDRGILEGLDFGKGAVIKRGDVARLTYEIIVSQLNEITGSLAAGNYTGPQKLELSTRNRSAKIYYTSDGTMPTKNSKLYTKAIPIDKTSTLKAIAVLRNIIGGRTIFSATYEIKPIVASNNSAASGAAGSTASGSSGASGGGPSGGGNGAHPGDATVYVASVAPISAEAEHYSAYALPAVVAATLSNGGTRDFAVEWAPPSADTGVCGVFAFDGDLAMPAGHANPSGLKASLTLTVNPALVSIAVAQPPAKTMYNHGEPLDISGLVVTGEYSDGSIRTVEAAVSDISGYGAEILGAQTLTVTLGGKTATFGIAVYAAIAGGNLVSVTTPVAIAVANGAAKTAFELNLPLRVEIVVDESGESALALADVAWDAESAPYDPSAKAAQTFELVGAVTLPGGIANGGGVPLEARVTVTVSAAMYAVRFSLSGQPGAFIPTQAVGHGSTLSRPADPLLEGRTFAGWFTDEELGSEYDWSKPVTSNFTLHAKFADTLMLAAAALTFDAIKGANSDEQGIMADLGLPASLLAFPGVEITWSSNDPSAISGAGAVTRPVGADAEVTLTATLALNGRTMAKAFSLIVRGTGAGGVDVEGGDTRYAPGYPAVSFDAQGRATIKIKLRPGTASAEHPVWAYLAFDVATGTSYIYDKESILFGHLVSRNVGQDGKRRTIIARDVAELEIADDGELVYTATFTWSGSTEEYKIGIVLLADDNADDPLAAATVVKIAKEEVGGYVDTTPPYYMWPFLSEDGRTVYAYFDERLSTAAANTPAPGDFTLGGAGASGIFVTALAISNCADDGNSWPGCATLALSGAIAGRDGLALVYTPGVNKLADANANEVATTRRSSIIAGAPSAKAYINPTAGTMRLQFAPGLHGWQSEYGNSALIDSLVSLRCDGSDVALDRGMSSWSTAATVLYYTFPPFPDGSYAASQFALSIASGLTFANLQTIAVDSQPAESILPQIAVAGAVAVYEPAAYGAESIILAFPSDIEKNGPLAACNLTLLIDGRRALYRARTQWGSRYGTIEITMPLTARLKAAIEGASAVTVSYTPDEHIKEPSSNISDITGAFAPAFGPVTVAR